MGQALAGVLPVIQTPFDDADRVDHAVLAHEVSWALEQGVDGFVVAMVSEYLRLSEDERIAVSRTTVEKATDLPVVVSVGAESSVVATLLTQRAESIGAAAVMAVPPLAARANDDELEIGRAHV